MGADGETAPCPSLAVSRAGGTGAAQGSCAGASPRQLCHMALGTRAWPAGCTARGTGHAEAQGSCQHAGVWQGSGKRAPGSASCTRASASPGTHGPLLYCKHLSSMAVCLF